MKKTPCSVLAGMVVYIKNERFLEACMFCSNCGKKVNEGAKFCWNCGSEIFFHEQNAVSESEKQTPVPPPSPAKEEKQEETQPAKKEALNKKPCLFRKKNKKLLLLIGGGVLALALLAILIAAISANKAVGEIPDPMYYFSDFTADEVDSGDSLRIIYIRGGRDFQRRSGIYKPAQKSSLSLSLYKQGDNIYGKHGL